MGKGRHAASLRCFFANDTSFCDITTGIGGCAFAAVSTFCCYVTVWAVTAICGCIPTNDFSGCT